MSEIKYFQLRTRNSIRGFVRPLVRPSIENDKVKNWKNKRFGYISIIFYMLVCREWGLDGGWTPLATRPHRYCDPPSLVSIDTSLFALILNSFHHQNPHSIFFSIIGYSFFSSSADGLPILPSFFFSTRKIFSKRKSNLLLCPSHFRTTRDLKSSPNAPLIYKNNLKI